VRGLSVRGFSLRGSRLESTALCACSNDNTTTCSVSYHSMTHVLLLRGRQAHTQRPDRSTTPSCPAYQRASASGRGHVPAPSSCPTAPATPARPTAQGAGGRHRSPAQGGSRRVSMIRRGFTTTPGAKGRSVTGGAMGKSPQQTCSFMLCSASRSPRGRGSPFSSGTAPPCAHHH
jgi:hypothetical protein